MIPAEKDPNSLNNIWELVDEKDLNHDNKDISNGTSLTPSNNSDILLRPKFKKMGVLTKHITGNFF